MSSRLSPEDQQKVEQYPPRRCTRSSVRRSARGS